MSLLRRIWRIIPDDAAQVAIVAALMPVFFVSYQVAWTLTAARIVFSVSVGLLGVLVGNLIQNRRPVVGYFIGSISIGATISALVSLLALGDPTWTWRTVMAGTQANVVLGWIMLWRLQDRWLARTIAFWATTVAAVGFALYLLSNFGIPDPISLNPLNWGLTEPKGIIARTLRYPLEPALAMILWTALIITLRRYLLRHGPGHDG